MHTDKIKFKTLEWNENKLILIDQRFLPNTERYFVCESVDDVVFAIKEMVVRGAPAIGCSAAFGFAIAGVEALTNLKITGNHLQNKQEDYFYFQNFISLSKDKLAKTRPTAVNLFWALNRMQKTLEANSDLKLHEIVNLLIDEAKKIYIEDINTNKKIGEYGSELITNESKILTHCNAGALATAGHGTALGIIRSAFSLGKKIQVYAGETRPFLQGARLTAWELIKDNIPVTLITDNMSGYLMSLGSIDAVIVGADRVTLNGDVINKVGTYVLAVLAAKHEIPFYVACPWSTIDLKTKIGLDVKIEERNPEEVKGFGDCNWTPEEVKIFNPAFDVTPANLVTSLVTEKGVLDPKSLKELEI